MLHSFRQGNRAEYLAHYILSSFALSVPVPRPEDGAGVDFHCSLLRKEGKSLFPYLPFNIQIKSISDKVVSYGGLTDGDNWREHELSQLCQTDTPFLIGMVDIKKQCLDIFSTISRYFVAYGFNNKPIPRQVDLIPYTPGYPNHLGDGVIEDLEPVNGKPRIPNKLWKLPLGEPIVSIPADAVETGDNVEAFKKFLEPYLRIDQQNAVHYRAGVGYFLWPRTIRTNHNELDIAWGWHPPLPGTAASTVQMDVLTKSMVSLLTSYAAAGQKDSILAWEPTLQLLPIDTLPAEMRQNLDAIIKSAKS